jgi:hypothetical protein
MVEANGRSTTSHVQRILSGQEVGGAGLQLKQSPAATSLLNLILLMTVP